MPQAVILCGGMGTRLGELTARTPKPLLLVAGEPFLQHLLHELGRCGFKDVILLAGFSGDLVEAFASGNAVAERFGIKLSVVVEPEPAGTSGALWHARDRLQPDFLLMNGDSWFDINLLGFYSDAKADETAVAKLALRHLQDSGRYGTVTLKDGHVTAFAERPVGNGPGLVNAGVYFCRKTILGYIQPAGSLERDVMPVLAGNGLLRGAVQDGFFIDIGVPVDLERCHAELDRRSVRRAAFLDRDGVLNMDFGHVGQIHRFEWIAGAAQTIRLLNDHGYLVFVFTNQAGVAKGYYAESDVAALHVHMQRELEAIGGHIDDFRYCPFHPEGTVPSYRKASDWRKPEPGMLLDLLDKWRVDRSGSFVIGDMESDIIAGQRASLDSFLFSGSNLLDFLTSEKLFSRPAP